MKKTKRLLILGILYAMICASNVVYALPVKESVQSIGNRLVEKQNKKNLVWPLIGTWSNDPPQISDMLFTGSIVSGMVDAYDLTSNQNYINSAMLGSWFILRSTNPDFFFGDEAYAMKRLSDISDNPQSNDPKYNPWRAALRDFYSCVQTQPEGTYGYVFDGYLATEPSTAVYYIAYNVVAAYYVDANDKMIWRQGLINWLSKVDDTTSQYPVLALGVATWALAKTGPLDSSLIDPSGKGVLYWRGKKLKDLPILLLTHQVPSGKPNEGSFYWQFGYNSNTKQYSHASTDPNGYTEDAMFATLGLTAVAQTDPNYTRTDPNIAPVAPFTVLHPKPVDPNRNHAKVDSALLAARTALLAGIDPNGKVYERLSRKGALYHVYAGEMLQVLKALRIPGDIDLDGVVNQADLTLLISKWLVGTNCSQSGWCNGADINRDGKVDVIDLTILADNWLSGQTHYRY